MQCKNCGKAERDHEALTRACPCGGKDGATGPGSFHETQRFAPHKQCRHKRDGICGKAGPCYSPACGG